MPWSKMSQPALGRKDARALYQIALFAPDSQAESLAQAREQQRASKT
jgi:hypothetical protein